MATHWAIDLGTSNTTVCVDVGPPPPVVAFAFGGGSLEAAVLHSHGSVVVETGRTDVLAKQAVARKLGLVQFGADVHVR